jgi:FkbH-like protein
LLFELDKYDRKLHRLEPATPKLPYQVATNVQALSLLYWAEHCVECAAPSCYQTCDLYQPRTDTRCRRFTFGAFKNRNFASSRGYGVEIAFKKWAKISAYGNLRLSATAKVLLTEKMAEWTAPAANAFGKIMAGLTKKARWNAVTHEALEELVRRLDRKKTKGMSPDAFLLEIYNPSNEVIRMQLTFSPLSSETQPKNALVQLTHGFSTTISCPPGYSRHEIDFALLGTVVASGDPFLISMIPEADTASRLVFLSADFVKFKQRLGNSGQKNVKCVVFDLDNTLWNGILIENDDVAVPSEIVALLKQFDERGILLSIASKNDHNSAWKKLQELGLSEYFLYPQINWNPKSQSVKTIAERLNIGIDAIAFVDDNPFELDEVARACPQVTCVNSAKIASLSSDPRFQGSSTPEARLRRQLYQDSVARELAQESFGSDYSKFLESCQIVLEISSYSPEQADRVAELVQRTNQLNFSGHKHTRPELEELLSNPLLDKFVLKCSDRYGSYGTVGFCLVEHASDTIRVQDFMLSCRVQGKLIEKAFFNHLLEQHNPHAATKLWVNFRSTQRNKPAQQVLESLGFRQCDLASGGSTRGMICSSFESLRCDVIQVHCSTPSHQSGMAVNLNPDIGELKYERR